MDHDGGTDLNYSKLANTPMRWDMMRSSDVIKVITGALRRVHLDVKLPPMFRELIRGPNQVRLSMLIYDDHSVAARAALSNGVTIRGRCATGSVSLLPVVTRRLIGTEGGRWIITRLTH